MDLKTMHGDCDSEDQRSSFCRNHRPVQSILDTVGNTPLISLSRVRPSNGSEIFGKLEARNPGGSIKDRIGLSMLRDAEEAGLLTSGMVIVEPTSGNTGIALSMAAAALGYELILTMPDSMSIERKKMLKFFGAKLILTPKKLGMTGAMTKAKEIKEEPERPHLQGMTKKELEAYGRTIGVELDRRHTKKKLIKTLQSSW